MSENQELHPMQNRSVGRGASSNPSNGSIDAIRDRIASVQSLELNEHLPEYELIHEQLERALAAIDGL